MLLPLARVKPRYSYSLTSFGTPAFVRSRRKSRFRFLTGLKFGCASPTIAGMPTVKRHLAARFKKKSFKDQKVSLFCYRGIEHEDNGGLRPAPLVQSEHQFRTMRGGVKFIDWQATRRQTMKLALERIVCFVGNNSPSELKFATRFMRLNNCFFSKTLFTYCYIAQSRPGSGGCFSPGADKIHPAHSTITNHGIAAVRGGSD